MILHPSAETVRLEANTVFVRFPGGSAILNGNSDVIVDVFRMLRGLHFAEDLVGVPEAAKPIVEELVAELRGRLFIDEPVVPAQKRALMMTGNGPAAAVLHSKLTRLLSHVEIYLDVCGCHEIERLTERLVTQSLRNVDVVVCVIEQVSWSELLSVNDQVIAGGQYPVLFVSCLGSDIVIGPLVTRGSTPCFRCYVTQELGVHPFEEGYPETVAALALLRASEWASVDQRRLELAADNIARMVINAMSPDVNISETNSAVSVIAGEGQIRQERVRASIGCPTCFLSKVSWNHERSLSDPECLELPWTTMPAQQMTLATRLRALQLRDQSWSSHATSSFRDHLLGTWRILTHWGQSPDICAAGLFHSIYGPSDGTYPLFDIKERSDIKLLIGTAAEDLVFLFCTMNWDILIKELHTLDHIPAGGVIIRNRYTEQELVLAGTQITALLSVQIANIAEQAHAEGLSPGIWVAECGHLATLIASVGSPLLPFSKGYPTANGEREARKAYLEGLSQICDAPEASQKLLVRAAGLNPVVGEPLAASAYVAIMEKDYNTAKIHAREAINRFVALGAAWDKRSPLESWLSLCNRLLRTDSNSALR
jgi:hypothetical protein